MEYSFSALGKLVSYLLTRKLWSLDSRGIEVIFVSDDLERKLAADCFRRGNVAMMKQNWDYSCEMFRHCVNLVPENVMFRQALRGVTEKKYNDNGRGASMAGMRLMGIKASINKSRMQSDWNAMIQSAEDGLAINPWDPSLNADLGVAMMMLGMAPVAIYCYERALKFEPGNSDYKRILQRLCGDDPDPDAGILVLA